MTQKQIRGEIYKLLEEKFKINLNDIRKTDFKKLLKQLGGTIGETTQQPQKPKKEKRVEYPDKFPKIEVWRADE